MEKIKSLELFEKAPIHEAVLKSSVPSIITMLMSLVYNLADIFFIGRTGNPYQLAAISLATPVFLIFLAMGNVFGIGGTSVVSRSLGKGEEDYARKVYSFCMWGSLAVGVIFSLLFIICMNPILKIIGTSVDTWEYTKTYLTIVCIAGPCSTLSNCFTILIRAEGKSTEAMLGQVIGNLVNVVLDPILILACGLEVMGAALATAFGNVVAMLIYVSFFARGKSSLGVSIKNFSMKDKIASSVFAIGIPAALQSFIMSVANIVMNSQMSKFGDLAVAGFGVAVKFSMLTRLMSIGLGHGVQPLLGFCLGAKLYERYRKVMNFSLAFSVGISATMTLICLLFTRQIASLFLSNLDALGYAVSFARIFLTTSALVGFYCVYTSAIEAIGAAKEALIVNISKQGLIYIPLIFIFGSLYEAKGLIWAQPVTDILSLALAIWLYHHASKKVLPLGNGVM